MKLIIAEKPDAAKKMAGVYGGKMNAEKTFLEVAPCPTFPTGAIFCFAIGHLVGLAEPEAYNEEWKKWDLSQLPMIPDNFKYAVAKDKVKAFNVIRKWVQDSRIDEITIASDAGREGEAIVWYVLNLSGINSIEQCRVPITRLWISSLTPTAIKKGFDNLRQANETYPYYEEARSRSIADWVVGMSVTRAATILLQNNNQAFRNIGVFSVGRVQTTLLSLLYKREKEIEHFKSEPFWNINATFNFADTNMENKAYKGKWFNEQSDRLPSKEQADEVAKACQNGQAVIHDLKQERKTSNAPQLFNLSALQTKANRLYKLSPQKTLEIAQALYTRGYLSYPRTDSQYMSVDEANTLPDILAKLGQKPEYADIYPTPKSSIAQDKRYTDASKVSDHHALLPTEQMPSALKDDEQKIYDLVVKSVFAAFYDEAIFDHTTIITKVHDHSFVSKGKVLVQEGWRKIFGEEKSENDEEQSLPSLSQNEVGLVKSVEVKEGKTQPPKRYSQGDLINLMKTAGRVADFDENELDDGISVKDAEKLGSIGTEATRANIIQTLLDRNYVNVKANKVYVEEKGKILIEALSLAELEIVSPLLTVKWEQKLEQIAKGQYQASAFIEEIKSLTTSMVSQLQTNSSKWNFSVNASQMEDDSAVATCPKCQSAIKEYTSKKDPKKKFYACSNFKGGCKVITNKVVAGKSISAAQVKKLFENGKTDVIKGFKGKTSTFDTFLYYNADENKVDFGFNHPDNQKEKSEVQERGTCLSCGKPLYEYEKVIKCSDKECKFAIFKTISSKLLPDSAIESLLKGETTELIDGFISSKTGKPFKAKLKYDLTEKRVVFDFDK